MPGFFWFASPLHGGSYQCLWRPDENTPGSVNLLVWLDRLTHVWLGNIDGETVVCATDAVDCMKMVEKVAIEINSRGKRP